MNSPQAQATEPTRKKEEIYASEAFPYVLEHDGDPIRRTREGTVLLREGAVPGRYMLQLVVRDKLDPAAPSRTASQWTDFEVK